MAFTRIVSSLIAMYYFIITIIYFTDCFKRNVGNMSGKMSYEEKKKKPYLSRYGDGTTNKSAGARMMVCGSVIKYSNVVRVREEAG